MLLKTGADPAAIDLDGRSVRERVRLENADNQRARQEMLDMIDQSLAKRKR